MGARGRPQRRPAQDASVGAPHRRRDRDARLRRGDRIPVSDSRMVASARHHQWRSRPRGVLRRLGRTPRVGVLPGWRRCGRQPDPTRDRDRSIALVRLIPAVASTGVDQVRAADRDDVAECVHLPSRVAPMPACERRQRHAHVGALGIGHSMTARRIDQLAGASPWDRRPSWVRPLRHPVCSRGLPRTFPQHPAGNSHASQR